MSTVRYLTLYTRECAEDDFRTDDGSGFPDDVEAVAVESAVCADEDCVLAMLESWGITEWDGGGTAYDPDGTHPIYSRGMRREQWVKVSAAMTCPRCGSDHVKPGRGSTLPSCYSCGTAWTTLDD